MLLRKRLVTLIFLNQFINIFLIKRIDIIEFDNEKTKKDNNNDIMNNS